MKERLQKIISSAGLASRRRAEELISAGRVTVNGAPASLGMSADPETDVVSLDGRRVHIRNGRCYIMLNKPRGYVTTLSDEKGRRTVAELVESAGRRLYPVGRLDMYSEGLLIMTDDGEAANALMHPANGVKKTYAADVSGEDIEASAEALRLPMTMDGRTVKAASVKILSAAGADGCARIEIVISEGRNRQVRRMCAAAGLKVKRLLRTSEGEIELGDLGCGHWRYLSENEKKYLHSLISDNGNR